MENLAGFISLVSTVKLFNCWNKVLINNFIGFLEPSFSNVMSLVLR